MFVTAHTWGRIDLGKERVLEDESWTTMTTIGGYHEMKDYDNDISIHYNQREVRMRWKKMMQVKARKLFCTVEQEFRNEYKLILWATLGKSTIILVDTISVFYSICYKYVKGTWHVEVNIFSSNDKQINIFLLPVRSSNEWKEVIDIKNLGCRIKWAMEWWRMNGPWQIGKVLYCKLMSVIWVYHMVGIRILSAKSKNKIENVPLSNKCTAQTVTLQNWDKAIHRSTVYHKND